MKKLKVPQLILLIAFVGMLCLSPLYLVLLPAPEDDARENRTLAELPALTFSGWADYPAAFTRWFDDHLPFRRELVTLNSAADYYIFRKPSDDRVIIGDDDWLFYNAPLDGDPMRSWRGEDLFTEEQLVFIADRLTAVDAYMKERGGEFVLFIAPNKERVYSERMPALYGEPAENYAALQLVTYLRENTDIRVVYPLAELLEAKASVREPLYFRTDTHWNHLGGYVGSRALLKELGIELPPLTALTVTEGREEEPPADLANMLGLADLLRSSDKQYTLTGYDEHGMERPQWEFRSLYEYRADADPRRLYVCRDSYAIYMGDVLGSQFSHSLMRYASPDVPQDVLDDAPDVYVYETVERYLPKLMMQVLVPEE